jgi:hypothetical protein
MIFRNCVIAWNNIFKESARAFFLLREIMRARARKPLIGHNRSSRSFAPKRYMCGLVMEKQRALQLKPLAEIERLAETEFTSLSVIHNIFTSFSLVI